MKKRNYLVLFITGMLAVSMLAGCGNTSSESTSVSSASSAQTEEDEEVSTDSEESAAEEEAAEEAAASTEAEEEVTSTSEIAEDGAEDEAEEGWETYYAVTIGTIMDALNESWDEDTLLENMLSPLLAGETMDSVGYAFQDLDGDDISEMIVGSLGADPAEEPSIYEVFTLIDGVEQPYTFSQGELLYIELRDSGEYVLNVVDPVFSAPNVDYRTILFNYSNAELLQSFTYSEESGWSMYQDASEGESLYGIDELDDETANAVIDSWKTNAVTFTYRPFSD